MIRSTAKTLVTGATGLVGNNVVRALLDQGRAVRVLQRASSDPRPTTGLDVEFAYGDVRDPSAVQRAVEGCELVIHAAAHVHIGWSGLEQHRLINVEGTRAVAQAARKHGARMIHVSSVDALGVGTQSKPADEESQQPSSMRIPYPLTKREAEQVVLQLVADGLDAVIVNPVFMFGPWDWKPSSGRMILEVARGKGLFAPRGGNDICDVRDVAAGILAAAEKGRAGRRYILGGQGMRYIDAWRLIAHETGGRRAICHVGPIVIRMAGLCGDLWGRVTGHEPDVNSATVSISSQPHHYSYERAKAELGYAPRPASEAIAAAWSWFLEHGYARERNRAEAR